MPARRAYRAIFAIAASTLFASVYSTASVRAAPFSFAQLTLIGGPAILVDPSKITAIASLPWDAAKLQARQVAAPSVITFPLPPLPKSTFASSAAGPLTTQVLGVFANLMPVKEGVEDVLKIAGSDRFIQLTLVSGIKIWMKATSIGWMLEKYPGYDDARIKCVVSLSLSGGNPTPVQEDIKTVRQLIETSRSKTAAEP
jgi:hypothetical protein